MMCDEHLEVFDRAKKDLLEMVNYDLRAEMSQMLSCTDEIQLDDIELGSTVYTYTDIKELIKDKPITILEKLIECIKKEDWKDNIEIIPKTFEVDLYRQNGFYFTKKIHIDGYRILTSISNLRINLNIKDDGEVIKSIPTETEVVSINYFNGEIVIAGLCQLPGEEWHLLDYMGEFEVELQVMGLKEIDVQACWIDYLLQGCIQITYENFRMSAMNIFSGMDKFIELMNEKILTYYIKNYSRLMEWTKNYLVDEFEQYRANPEIREARKQEIIDLVDEELRRKIIKYSKENRRIKDKLLDALRAMGIKGDVQEYQSLYLVIKQFDSIEKVRNAVAHGDEIDIDTDDMVEIIYTVFTIIFSIILQRNLHNNMWHEIIA